MEEKFFCKKVGRLYFYFSKNGSKIQIEKVFIDEDCDISDIRAFPHEREFEEAKKEAYRYFGLRPPPSRKN